MNKDHRSSNPLTWVLSAYFAQGLPFVAIASASALMFKNMGISDTRIAFWTSLIMLPWTLKPLWGPFLELYRTKKFFAVFTQITIGLLFGLVALSLALPDFFAVSIAVLAVIALMGATHDMAVDGVYLNVLDAKRQAKYVGWQGAAYNLAKIFSSGALVWLAGELEKSQGVSKAWMIVMGLYGVIMLCIGIYHTWMLPADQSKAEPVTLKEGFDRLGNVVTTFFQKKYIWYGIVFIILYRFAEGQAIKIAPLFLKAGRDAGGLGLDTSQIGIAYGTFGSLAYLAGSLAAGYFVSSRGLSRTTLMILCACFNLPFLMYALLAIFQPTSFAVITSAIAIEYFGYGFGFVGLILFMMQQIAPGDYKMAHYAFATGIMNLGVMLPSMISGYVSDMLGYKNFFIWVMVATIPAFIATWLVPLKKVEEEDSEQSQN